MRATRAAEGLAPLVDEHIGRLGAFGRLLPLQQSQPIDLAPIRPVHSRAVAAPRAELGEDVRGKKFRRL